MAGELIDVGVLLEDYAAFGEWLAVHAEAMVGLPLECAACPLAIWLDEVARDERHVGNEEDGAWLVTPARCRRRDGWETWALPAWARLFVEGVDARYGCYACVTGGMALEVLRAVVR